jgi:hypothetical protein
MEAPPEFDDGDGCVEEGRISCAPKSEQGRSKRPLGVQNMTSRGASPAPKPVRTNYNLSARDASGPRQASQRRDARWPASNGKGPSPRCEGGSETGGALTGGALDLGPIEIDRAALDRWAGMLVALEAKRLAQEARAWLGKGNLCAVSADKLLVKNTFVAERVDQVFGTVLRDHGFSVAVTGSG